MVRVEKFSYEPNGYNRKEVNQFISDVIEKTENIIERCQEQRKEIEKLEQELEHYHNLENGLKDAIIRAEQAADNIKKMAREEAKIIIDDSKNSASRIINESLLKAEKIENKRDILEKNIKIFKRKLKIIMEQQQAVVEEIDELELKDQ